MGTDFHEHRLSASEAEIASRTPPTPAIGCAPPRSRSAQHPTAVSMLDRLLRHRHVVSPTARGTGCAKPERREEVR